MKKLKKDIIVYEILSLLAEKSLKEREGDMRNVYLPLQNLIQHINKKFGMAYHSEHHLYNQLKNYEKAESIDLFNKKTIGDEIYIRMREFHNFKHLAILNKTIKLMISNGCVDMMKKLLKDKPRWNVYLDDGSECYYIAKLLFSINKPLNIYTNNLGIIQNYHECDDELTHITLHTRTGIVHKETYSIIETPNQDFFTHTEFDITLHSPRYIRGTTVCEVFPEVKIFKKAMLERTKGIKIMPLTLFEFALPKEQVYSYGDINDFDYIVLPPRTTNATIYQEFIDTLPLEAHTAHPAYNIFKIKK